MTSQSVLLDEISGMLSESDIFNHLPSFEIQSVRRYFNISQIARGEVIFHEGEPGNFMCVLHEGIISVMKANQAGENVEMARISRGRALGEMAVLDNELRSATCVAATDCVLLTLSSDALDQMLEEAPRPGAKILRAIAVSLSRRLRMAVGKLVDYPV
jgi:CRP-like cAMP-binding protein